MSRHEQETRERLLEEAARLFAARGFARVTVRDICEAARANVAAVNYHFQGKDGLYHAVVQTAIDRMRGTTDTIVAAGRGRAPEERLTSYIAIFLQRVTEMRDNWIHQLMVRELTEPTAALDLVVQQVLEPRMNYLGGIIAELIDCRPDDPRVRRSAMSVQMQCVAAIDRRLPMHNVPATAAEVAALADHIARFSIGGITALRQPRPRQERPGSRRVRRAPLPRRPARP